jgi:CheY-like chemotaxis protein
MTRNHRILLVEDRDPDVRLTKRAIKKAGYTVDITVAVNGKEALDKLRDVTSPLPDLVLLDWMMPLVDGSEVLQAMRQDPRLRSVPVIVLTTSSSEGDVASAYDKGCNAYLTKPINPQDFQETIRVMGLFWLDQVLLPKAD